MSETFEPGRPPEASSDGVPLSSMTAEPLEMGGVDMGFQIGLLDAAGMAAMMSGRIPR
jgi:hypothetical protein